VPTTAIIGAATFGSTKLELSIQLAGLKYKGPPTSSNASNGTNSRG